MNGALNKSLTADQIARLEYDAKDYLHSHGIATRMLEDRSQNDFTQPHAVTLLPSPVPQYIYYQACQVQKDYNLLMYYVSRDKSFMHQCLKNVIEVDDFIKRLWNIYETITQEGIEQNIVCMVNRNDYMIDCGLSHQQLTQHNQEIPISDLKLRQVEFNTIAAALSVTATKVSKYHRFTLEAMSQSNLDEKLPSNPAGEGQTEALVTAFNLYGNPKAVIMFLVHEVEFNVYDQRLLEYKIHKMLPKVIIIRKTMAELSEEMTLTKDRRLIVDNKEVGLIYFRTCYEPKLFTNEQAWVTRLNIERSNAIKQPSIASQLAGTKKIQQVLAEPGTVERFLGDTISAKRVRETFAGQYSLDQGPEGDKNAAAAIANPEKYVMKPQLEGGGNNLFGEDISAELIRLADSPLRNSYILMEKIYPTPLYNYPIQIKSKAKESMMASELGIFGNLVANGDDIVINNHKGHLLRTKFSGVDEGGVAISMSFIDSPYII